MELEFHGANCIALTTKNARVVIDDNLTDLNGLSITKSGDIVLFTSAHGNPQHPPKILIDQPGEYEVSGITIHGLAARAHVDEAGKHTATLYKILADDFKLLLTGHIYPELSEAQLESIGMVDVMLVPVGGNGYTLDPTGALALIKKVEPKIIIPTHYNDLGLNFPVPQVSLEDALKVLAMEVKERSSKLKPKLSELGGETTQLIVLERS